MDGVETGPVQPGGVLPTLREVCVRRGLEALDRRLGSLQAIAQQVDSVLAKLAVGETSAHQSARHILRLPGKRLRPLCVVLGANVGAGVTGAVRDLCVAVELVHNATLLHDDVVDLGELRRNAPTARAVYGNAASIFAGDWLLVEALRRVRATGISGLLDRLLDVIEQMIVAESLQLDQRGSVVADRDLWLRIARGKTASLFEWALYAGGRAGGLGDNCCEALAEYGQHVGIAFQAIDDVLDVQGGPTGKDVLCDLREGKMTLPWIFAVERERTVATLLLEAVSDPGAMAHLMATTSEILQRTEACASVLAFAADEGAAAIHCLRRLPRGAGVDALEAAARATLERSG